MQGQIDWSPIVAALREIDVPGEFNLEIPGVRQCPPELRDAQARYALEVTERLLAG
jgi:sugar phosphate isomerase/epimerase